MKKQSLIAVALTTGLLLSNSSLTQQAFSQYEYNADSNYAKYYDQGIQYYNSNEYSKAIEQFTQALKLAPNNAPIRNNLAASYISRGTYYHNTAKNFDEAIDNYLDAIYYLKYDAPENAPASPNATDNLNIVTKNLANAFLATGSSIDNTSNLFKKAKDLRTKGKFRASIVTYYMALEKSPQNPEALEAIGDMYKVLQNNERAAKAYEKAMDNKGGTAALFVKAGLTYEKADNINEAIKAYNKASELDPKNPDALNALQRIWENQIKINPRNAPAHANLGTVLQKKGDLEGAKAQYEAAEAIEPNNIFVRLNLGTLYQAKGDKKTAIRAYDTILQIEPKNTLAHYYKATALKELRDYAGASRELNSILQYEPNSDLAKKELIEIAKLKGESTGEVVNLLKDIADKNPSDAKSQYDAAFEAHSKGDLTTAITYYKKTIALNPKMFDAYANLGAALLSKKQYNEAEDVLNKASAINPSNDKVQSLLSQIKDVQKSSKYQDALTLHQQGKIKEAILAYEEAYKSDPNNAELLTNLGAAYQSNKNYDMAIDKYKKAVVIDPNSAIPYYYMANAQAAKGDTKEAIINYKKALSIEPNNTQYKEALQSVEAGQAEDLLANALKDYNSKQYSKAKITIEQALKVDPNNASAYYYMGLIMEGLNNSNLAIANYKKSIQLDPKMDNAYYALGIVLDKVNDKAGAKDAFTKYVQLAGNRSDAFVNYAKSRIKQL